MQESAAFFFQVIQVIPLSRCVTQSFVFQNKGDSEECTTLDSKKKNVEFEDNQIGGRNTHSQYPVAKTSSLPSLQVTPQGKELLKNINLGMYLGAKIGFLGPNGAGKSTLMKILAGVDKEFDGDLYLDPGIKIGYLAQEPQLTAGETVMENIEVHQCLLLRRF